MKLRTKFNLVVLVAFAAGFTLTGIILKEYFDNSAKQEVLQTANVMLAAANSVRHYTTDQIAPVVGSEQNGKFLSISIPSFAAQTNLHGLGPEFSDYRYKEAALNPTNPADRAADWEADVINDFRADPNLKQMTFERDTPTGTMIVVAHGLKVGDPSCLSCHSVPSAAPASMIQAFGTANGFGWHLNETVGAQVVSLPLGPVMARATQNLILYLGLLVGVFLVMLIIFNLMLNFLVIKPVKTMARIATEVSLGNSADAEFEMRGDDEISALATAFNRMRRSLASAITMMEEEEAGAGAAPDR